MGKEADKNILNHSHFETWQLSCRVAAVFCEVADSIGEEQGKHFSDRIKDLALQVPDKLVEALQTRCDKCFQKNITTIREIIMEKAHFLNFLGNQGTINGRLRRVANRCLTDLTQEINNLEFSPSTKTSRKTKGS